MDDNTNYSSWNQESISRKFKQNPPLVGHSVVYIVFWEIRYNPNHLTKQIRLYLHYKQVIPPIFLPYR